MNEFVKDIIISLISGLIYSLITFLLTKTYLGFKNFRGLKNMVRLNKDCYSSGIINVFQNRKAYAQHKDHGTSIEYMLKAEHNLIYIGYWLASATEMDDYKSAIKKLVEEKITVTLVLLNPYNVNSLDICSKYIGISSDAIKNRINCILPDLFNLKEELGSNSKYLVIKIHNEPLTTSVFILDYNKKEKCRVLLDYKLFSSTRSDSYGIEFQNNEKIITNKIVTSYRELEKKSLEINSLSEIHSQKNFTK